MASKKGVVHCVLVSKHTASALLVGVCVVDIVLDPPGLKGVYEGRKHEGANNVLNQLVFAEGSVASIVPHHKKLHDISIMSQGKWLSCTFCEACHCTGQTFTAELCAMTTSTITLCQ